MNKINTISPNHKLYQQRLNKLADVPKKLYYKGNLNALDLPAVAIVGTRKPSTYGINVTQKFARELANRRVAVVSGLALGVDILAHKAVIEAGGVAIAVLPSGLDNIYPFRHRQIANKILESKGILLSEHPEGTPPLKYRFIQRNRIVAALSDGLLVTEASKKSGTLHTASFALDMGISVMAVPGAITNPFAQGTNSLIKTGATLVDDIDDILFAIGFKEESKNEQLSFIADTYAEQVIFDLLKNGITNGEELAIKSGLSASEFSQTLTMMEITGKVYSLGQNHWTLK